MSAGSLHQSYDQLSYIKGAIVHTFDGFGQFLCIWRRFSEVPSTIGGFSLDSLFFFSIFI